MKVKLYYLNELNPLAQIHALANAVYCERSIYSAELNAMRERLKGGADEFARRYGFDNANQMIEAVVLQAEEDYQLKTLEFCRRK